MLFVKPCIKILRALRASISISLTIRIEGDNFPRLIYQGT